MHSDSEREDIYVKQFLSISTYQNIDISGLKTMGGRGLEGAISKGHISLFLINWPNIDINILAHPRYRPKIDIHISTHPRDHRDIAIAVSQDALAK